MSKLDNSAPGIGTSNVSLIGSGVGMFIGVVTLSGFSVDLHWLLRQNPKPGDFDQMPTLNASAVAVSGLYVLSSLFLACAVGKKLACGRCFWVVMTLLEIGVMIYGATQNQTTALIIAVAIPLCLSMASVVIGGIWLLCIISGLLPVPQDLQTNLKTQNKAALCLHSAKPEEAKVNA